MTLVWRIGARCIWLLVGALLRDVSRLTTPKASDLTIVVVVVVPAAVVVIGVFVSWPGIGILPRLVARMRCRRSSLLRLIGWFGWGWLPGARLLVAGTTLADHLALASVIHGMTLVFKHESLVHQVKEGSTVADNEVILQDLLESFHEAFYLNSLRVDIFRGIP